MLKALFDWINQSRFRNEIIVIAALVILGGVIYADSFFGVFQFDDFLNIVDNAGVRMERLGVKELIRAWHAHPTASEYGRPILYLTLAFNYWMSGYREFGYHLVNLIIHLGSGILVFFILKTTLTLRHGFRFKEPEALFTAGLASLLWISHPAHTEAVTYIIQRKISLAGFFSLVALLFYLKGRVQIKPLFFILAAVAWLLALGTHQYAAAVLLILLLYEFYFFPPMSAEEKSRRRLLVITMLGGLLILVITFIPYILNWWTRYQGEFYSPQERAFSLARILLMNISLLILPTLDRLSLEYNFIYSKTLLEPATTVMAWFAVGIWLILLLIVKRRKLGLCFASFWTIFFLLPELSPLPMDPIFMKRLYLPAVGWSLLSALAFHRVAQYASNRRWMRGLIVIAALALIAWQSLITVERNSLYRSELSLWQDAARKAPLKDRAHYNLGVALIKAERYAEAVEELRAALRLNPKHLLAINNLASALRMQGQFSLAEKYYREALQINPNIAEVHNNIATLLIMQGRRREAQNEFMIAVKLRPDFDLAYANLANLFREKGNFKEAARMMRRALEINPSSSFYLANLGIILIQMQDMENGEKLLLEALRIDPESADIHYNLARFYISAGRFQEAYQHLKETIRLRPMDQEAHAMLQRLITPPPPSPLPWQR